MTYIVNSLTSLLLVMVSRSMAFRHLGICFRRQQRQVTIHVNKIVASDSKVYGKTEMRAESEY